MKKIYKLLSIVLAIVMVISMIPMTVAHASAEESYCINITNKPGTSFELEHDFTSGVYDLWNEIDSNGSGELAFNQSFSVNINDAIEVYNNYLDTEYNGERDQYKASEDINNDATFYVEAKVWINNTGFSSSAIYQLHPYDLRPHENFSYGKWSLYDNELSEEFFSMSIDGYVLNISLDGTVKEIYESLKAQDESLSETTVDSMSFEVRVSCEVEYMDWYIKSTEYNFEAITHSLYDKHIYESSGEYDTLSAISTIAPLTANVAPAYEGCYEPIKTEYNWYYEFIKEGYDTDEDDQWYGYFERDENKESDVLTETAPSGTVFGVAYGTVDSGDKNYITLSDILNEKNKDFINSFIGAKPRELGGNGQMFIGCTVTLTFADGKQCKVDVTKADYMSKLIAPCMHACTVCGYCTVTDEMLPCNFDQMSYDISNVCICDQPSVPEFEVTVEAESQLTIESTERIVNVVVEKIEVEETPTHSFIVNTTDAVGADNVIAFYNINVFDEAGYPYTLNQWYDEGEELTVSVPVSMEEALALQSGEAALYHILADGTAEEVEGVTVTIDGESATMTFTSNSFSPYIVARKVSTYTVTYDANGGSGFMTSENLIVNESGFATSYVFPECGFTAPDGKEFDKWQWYYNSNPEQVNEITPSQSPWISGDITVKAIWKDITQQDLPVTSIDISCSGYEIGEKIADAVPTTSSTGVTIASYEWQDNNGTKLISGTFEADTQYRLQVFLNVAGGYTADSLLKANVRINDVETTYFTNPCVGIDAEQGDMKIYHYPAKLIAPQPIEYIVTYDANGGSGSMESESLTANESGFATSYIFPECGFTAPDGKEFDKWQWYYNSNPEQVNEITPGQSPWISGDITVKALWKDIPNEITSVTATINGVEAGATVGSITVTTNDTTYTVSIKGWYDCDSVFSYDTAPVLQPTDTLVGGKTYTVGVTFTPASGNVLSNNLTTSINGESGKIGGWDSGSRNYFITITIPSTINYGDVNNDGEINNRDICLIVQHINGWRVEISPDFADVNVDGKINNKDYVLLVRFVNGWDITLGE